MLQWPARQMGKYCRWSQLRGSGSACRRLELLENRTEQVSSMLADIQKVEGLREDAMKERFSSMEKTLRDVHRGVQIVRDKQVWHKLCSSYCF